MLYRVHCKRRILTWNDGKVEKKEKKPTSNNTQNTYTSSRITYKVRYTYQFGFSSSKHCPGCFFSRMCAYVCKCYILVPQPQTAPDVTARAVAFTLFSHEFTIDGNGFFILRLSSLDRFCAHRYMHTYTQPSLSSFFHVKIASACLEYGLYIFISPSKCFFYKKVHLLTGLWKQGKKIRRKWLSKSVNRTIKNTNLRHLLKQKLLHRYKIR